MSVEYESSDGIVESPEAAVASDVSLSLLAFLGGDRVQKPTAFATAQKTMTTWEKRLLFIVIFGGLPIPTPPASHFFLQT